MSLEPFAKYLLVNVCQTGLTDYTANNTLKWITGAIAEPTLPSVFLALFTAVGVDAGTGFTEVSGGSYARVQVAGNATVNATTANTSTILHFAAPPPSWITSGMYVYDATTPLAIGVGTTVTSISANTIVLSQNTGTATVGATDSIVFTSFATATSTMPSQMTNSGVITFPQATANWGNVIAFGLYDAVSSGNFLTWDFLGNYSWLPTTISSSNSAFGAMFTSHAHGYVNSTPVVATVEYGGTLPTVTQGALNVYTVNYVANVATDTYQLSSNSITADQGSTNTVWTTTTGDCLARQIVIQAIPQNVTASFAASTLTITAA